MALLLVKREFVAAIASNIIRCFHFVGWFPRGNLEGKENDWLTSHTQTFNRLLSLFFLFFFIVYVHITVKCHARVRQLTAITATHRLQWRNQSKWWQHRSIISTIIAKNPTTTIKRRPNYLMPSATFTNNSIIVQHRWLDWIIFLVFYFKKTFEHFSFFFCIKRRVLYRRVCRHRLLTTFCQVTLARWPIITAWINHDYHNYKRSKPR